MVPLLPAETPELDSVQGGPWRVPWRGTSKAAEASGSSNWRQRSQPCPLTKGPALGQQMLLPPRLTFNL